MPKLRVLSAREVCKILQNHGFTLVRQRAVTSSCAKLAREIDHGPGAKSF